MIYYAAFVPGMQEVIAGIVRERLTDAVIKKLLDGAILFESACTYDKLNFLCFNNIFAVISISDTRQNDEHAAPVKLLEAHIRKAAAGSNRTSPVLSGNNQKIKTFRVICSAENQPVAINPGLKQEAEHYITRESGLEVNRSKPDTEFWFLYRREGSKNKDGHSQQGESFSLFMKRLTKHASFDKMLHPGELTPQLAWLLCYLSKPKHSDTVIDPFCGYGSIPEQRTKHFPFTKMYALDIDGAPLSVTKNKLQGKQDAKCEIIKKSIEEIFKVISPGEADAIITDPPWGMYKEIAVSLQRFYDDMLITFSRLLKDGGRAVVLTAKKAEFELSISKTPELQVTKTFHILVSGKKAAVYVVEKIRL
jgi:tRNA G10  N-methylase Trm11